jgi:hypothetical protein
MDGRDFNTQNSIEFQQKTADLAPKNLFALKGNKLQIGSFNSVEDTLNQYTSTYNFTMKPNKVEPFKKYNVNNNSSSIVLDIPDNQVLRSESQSKYILIFILLAMYLNQIQET